MSNKKIIFCRIIVLNNKLALRPKNPVSQIHRPPAEAAGFAISQSTDHGGIGQRDTAPPHRNAFPLLYEALQKEKARRPDAFASESAVLFVSNVISDCYSRRFADSAAKRLPPSRRTALRIRAGRQIALYFIFSQRSFVRMFV